MDHQDIYRACVRIVFLFAFIAFLSASISHVAVFFHNFEADKENWLSPYMLAVSIDLTALVLTIGVMFFSKSMTWFGKTITWTFIVFLTAFSWFVNWEYARTYQAHELKAGSLLILLNPILASSFAFLNLAYSFVSEQFNAKTKTQEELELELEDLERSLITRQKKAELKAKYSDTSVVGFVKKGISGVKEIANHAGSTFSQETMPLQEAANSSPMVEPSPNTESTMVEQFDNEMLSSDDSIAIEDLSASSTSGSTSPRNVSLEEAGALLNCNQSVVKQLLTRGKLKSPHGSKNSVTRASIKEYLASKRAHNKKANDVETQVNDMHSTANDVAIAAYQIDSSIPTSDIGHALNDHSNGYSAQDTEALSIPLLSIARKE